MLDAERSLFSAELTYAQTQGILFGALVNLYKSMGGGWVVEADKLTSPETYTARKEDKETKEKETNEP